MTSIFDRAPISFRTPLGLVRLIDAAAARRGIHRADVIRRAIADWFTANGEPLPPKMSRAMRGAA